EGLRLCLVGADEEEPGVRQPIGHRRHRVEHVVVALPRPDADLRDEEVLGAQAELAADRAAVHAWMEAVGVGARVDDLDLLRRDALADEPLLDRGAHGDDRGHSPRRDGHVGTTRREAQDQLAELDRRAREIVLLRVELQDPKRLRHQAPKNFRTAATTVSISASAWLADIGSVRISWTSRSVRGSV